MSARLRLAGLGLALAVVAVFASPLLLRHMDFFLVRQVELVGLRYLAPESILVALELPAELNLFDDRRALEERAERLPGVVAAQVRRRPPGTLQLVFRERPAVAFAPGPEGLVALDTAARPLPYHPAVTGLDLPVIPRPDTQLVRTLWQVRVRDSALYREVQSARRLGPDGVVLELTNQELVVRSIPSAEEIRALGAVRNHLAATGRRFELLDARFAGRVFARRGGV